MEPLRLSRILGSKAEDDLRLPNNGLQQPRNSPTKPIDAGLRMLPGSCHCKSHCVSPLCVTTGDSHLVKSTSYEVCSFAQFFQPLAETESAKCVSVIVS